MGDLNSKVGSERTEHISRPFEIGKKIERGDRLIEFCKKHNFPIINLIQKSPKKMLDMEKPRR